MNLDSMSVGRWASALRRGLSTSGGWFWVAFTVTLNIFTTATIALTLVDGEGLWIAAAVDAVAITVLVAFVLIQAPYRGQRAETEDALAELDNERTLRRGVKQVLEPFLEVQRRQRHEPETHIEISVSNMGFKEVEHNDAPRPTVAFRIENYLQSVMA